MNTPKIKRQFIAFWWFVNWENISLGLSICWAGPHVEFHLPFGFIKIGWDRIDVNNEPINHQELLAQNKGIGLRERYEKKSWVHE